MAAPRPAFVRPLTPEDLARLAARQDELRRQMGEQGFSEYKWFIAGIAVSIPLPRLLNLRGSSRFLPLVVLASAGSIADFAHAHQATMPQREELYAWDRLRHNPASFDLRLQAVRKGVLADDALAPAAPDAPGALRALHDVDVVLRADLTPASSSVGAGSGERAGRGPDR